MDILLPVGLSFYIFQGMSYAIDRYRDTALKPMTFLDVLLFVSFFPVVLSGPIMRSSQFFPQLMEDSPAGSDEEYEQLEKKLINRDIAEGFSYILSGLFKKVVLASYLSEHIVRDVFQSPEFYSSETVLVAMYAYAMQIFCDFSGYTDIAIGIGRLIGFKIPQNFNAPYLATSLKEFWHRWHISLSAWLRDYVYFSLGGNRKGNKYINLFITMTLGGLWHGSHLRFLIWGMAHGLGLVFNHAWTRYNPCKAMLKNGFLQNICLFLMVSHFSRRLRFMAFFPCRQYADGVCHDNENPRFHRRGRRLPSACSHSGFIDNAYAGHRQTLFQRLRLYT